MPTYGKAKIKDIVRSVLPSKRRRQARHEKANANRVRRRNVRQAVGKALLLEEDDLEGFDEAADVEDRKNALAVHDAVNERRAADKVEPLIKWAKASIRGLPDKRIAKLRSLVPNNTIGEHAIGHVKGLDGFDGDTFAYKSSSYRGTYKAPEFLSVKEMEVLLTKPMRETPDLHRPLNLFVRHPLAGIHKIKEYVEASRKGNYDWELSQYLIAYRDGGPEGVQAHKLAKKLNPYSYYRDRTTSPPPPKAPPELKPKPKLTGKPPVCVACKSTPVSKPKATCAECCDKALKRTLEINLEKKTRPPT